MPRVRVDHRVLYRPSHAKLRIPILSRNYPLDVLLAHLGADIRVEANRVACASPPQATAELVVLWWDIA